MSDEFEPNQLQYVDQVNANLICCICRLPFTNPHVTPCTHTFCKDCITKALTFQSECPVDRAPLTLEKLIPANTLIRNLVDELMVECPNAAYGCTTRCQRQLLAGHLSHYCEHVSTACCEPDCDDQVLRKDVDSHAHNCGHRIVLCEACETPVKQKDLEDHLAITCLAADWTCSHCSTILARSSRASHLIDCPNLIIPCTHSTHGCPHKGPRHESQNHLTTCPYEAIKGFFALSSTRLEALESENTTLRQKVSRLEGYLGEARKEVESVRSSLGPWYRPSGSRTPPLTPQPRAERPTRRRLSIPLNTASFGAPSHTDDDASTHPSTAPSRSTTRQTRSHSPRVPNTVTILAEEPDTSGFFSQETQQPSIVTEEPYMTSYFDHPPSVPSGISAAQSRVAPVDLSTSLEGCLTSLRNSIVTTNATLDSLERRQDIALTTETLRMREDVASLRAIVHGLRMQVHTIMMDRNVIMSGRTGASAFFPQQQQNLPPPSHYFGATTTTTTSYSSPHNPDESSSLDGNDPSEDMEDRDPGAPQMTHAYEPVVRMPGLEARVYPNPQARYAYTYGSQVAPSGVVNHGMGPIMVGIRRTVGPENKL